MVLSVLDYKWAQELLSLPTWVMTADDDATLYTYIAENDDHIYADDYVPNLQMNGAPVSQYQLIYLAGSLCFTVSGSLDVISEQSLWPSFRLLAGAFGVASAVYISGNDFELSNVFNLVSVHCYVVDSLTMFRHNRCCAVTMEAGKWTNKYLLLGDFAYFSGSVIDVVVRTHCMLFSECFVHVISNSDVCSSPLPPPHTSVCFCMGIRQHIRLGRHINNLCINRICSVDYLRCNLHVGLLQRRFRR